MLSALGKQIAAVSENDYNFLRTVIGFSLTELISVLTFHSGISLTGIHPKIYVQFHWSIICKMRLFFKGMRGGFYVAINRRAAIERSLIPEVKKGKLWSGIHNMTLKFHRHMFMCVKKISGKIQK